MERERELQKRYSELQHKRDISYRWNFSPTVVNCGNVVRNVCFFLLATTSIQQVGPRKDASILCYRSSLTVKGQQPARSLCCALSQSLWWQGNSRNNSKSIIYITCRLCSTETRAYTSMLLFANNNENDCFRGHVSVHWTGRQCFWCKWSGIIEPLFICINQVVFAVFYSVLCSWLS